ncbi:hypothetical protein F8388_017573 [Cannabis sativa]|uniref:Uncharacterized protein n=1 Tax=Cannabis sativa TaxID=3483 RepID=A0A7J6DV65_CANSA|nr:hypothetical protein F8388_017573 [Cannabis sativa]
MLQIIDMSHNYFIGSLPYEYMFSWNSMKDFKMSNLTYMKAWENITFNSNAIGQAVTGYDYSTTIVWVECETENLAEERIPDPNKNTFRKEIPSCSSSSRSLPNA